MYLKNCEGGCNTSTPANTSFKLIFDLGPDLSLSCEDVVDW